MPHRYDETGHMKKRAIHGQLSIPPPAMRPELVRQPMMRSIFHRFR